MIRFPDKGFRFNWFSEKHLRGVAPEQRQRVLRLILQLGEGGAFREWTAAEPWKKELSSFR